MGRRLAEATNADRMRATRGDMGRRFRVLAVLAARCAAVLAVGFLAADPLLI
jgi:hypothetical protein